MLGAAPAVRYPAVRSRRLAWALLVLAAVQLLALLLLAVLSHSPSPAAIAAQSLAAAAVCTLLLQFWRARQQPRELHWDGQLWRVQAAPGSQDSVELEASTVALDAQRCLLLCCRARKSWRTLWLWLDADAAPEHWHALRCALYFSLDNPGVARRLEEALP